MNPAHKNHSAGRRIRRATFGSLAAVLLFTSCTNILMLTPSIYMLQVYDRVVGSGSIPTLYVLTAIAVFLLFAIGLIELARSRVLVVVSQRLDRLFNAELMQISQVQALVSGGVNNQASLLRDLNGVRQFLTGNGIFAFFDLIWFPFYLWVMYYFHPVFGGFGVAAALVLLCFAVINNYLTAAPMKSANAQAQQLQAQTSRVLANAEVTAAMGMQQPLFARLDTQQREILRTQARSSRRAGLMMSLSKSTRMIVQSAILGVGAYLAVRQEISPGMMIAGSILLGRALAPIDQVIAAWGQFTSARQQFAQLCAALNASPKPSQPMQLPAPKGRIDAQAIFVGPPGGQNMVVKNLSVTLAPGDCVGLLGPSGAGKSTLVRALLGIWPCRSGLVRIDGTNIADWPRERLGPSIGYLPQDVELFDGTVAQNIARFGEVDAQAVIAAAQAADIDGLIKDLPGNYDANLSQVKLSPGQRQRVGLARALYGSPCWVVLDEPNSNLDQQGEQALKAAIRQLKQRGATVLLISHEYSTFEVVDKLMLLDKGVMTHFGPRDQVWREGFGEAPPFARANVTSLSAIEPVLPRR